MLIWIGFASYWTIPPIRVEVEGDFIIAYDSEIGFVPRPNSSSKRLDSGPDGRPNLEYHLYTDRRGARVSHPGEQSPDHVEILIVGDSFTWGHGVENQETFTFRTMSALGVTGANLALGGYGTTHSLQMLRRNRDLEPKLVILGVTSDQPRRNILACAPSYYPFCLDYSHVAWNEHGQPYIARPRSDGVKRHRLHMHAEKNGLDPLTWIIHGVDAAVAKAIARKAQLAAMDSAKQDAALEYLMGEITRVADEMKATLLIVYIPGEAALPPPEMLSLLASKLSYSFLDLSQPFVDFKKTPTNSSLYLPNDGHPSAAAHALIAEELVSFIHKEKILSP